MGPVLVPATIAGFAPVPGFRNRDPIDPGAGFSIAERFYFENRDPILRKKSGIDFVLRLWFLICHGFLIAERFLYLKSVLCRNPQTRQPG
jgi:hypothetical protein